MGRSHLVITGTGRSGTTFLVELLTHLGLETGFTPVTLHSRKSKLARAGLEHDIRDDDAPYVVKSPWFCEHVDEVIERRDIKIDHVFIPMRDLKAAAESRRYVTNEKVARMSIFKRLRFRIFPKTVTGGLWHAHDVSEQEYVLLSQIYQLILSLSKTTIPVTLLHYPRIVQDSRYLFEKLQPVLGKTSELKFQSTFAKVVRIDLVHCFNANDCWAA